MTEMPVLHVVQFFLAEPGYYEEGEFGIRLETIVEVVEAETHVCLLMSSGVKGHWCRYTYR